MMCDLLSSPQGHQFDPMFRILPAFYSTYHSRQFTTPQEHVRKNYFFYPLGIHSAPKYHPEHDPMALLSQIPWFMRGLDDFTQHKNRQIWIQHFC